MSETISLVGAERAHREAVAARDSLLDSAARGGPANTEELRAAERAVTDCESDVRLAQRVEQHRRAERERAAIVALWAEARRLDGEAMALVQADFQAAQSVDRAVAAARAAADAKNDAASALADKTQEIQAFNEQVKIVPRTNAELAKVQIPEQPRARMFDGVARNFGAPMRVELVLTVHGYRPECNAQHDVVQLRTAEQIARGSYGKYAPPQ